MKNVLTVNQLNVGERFIIPELKDTMRNLKVERVSECATYVSGSCKESIDGPWKPFRNAISNSVEVIVDTSEIPVEIIEVIAERDEMNETEIVPVTNEATSNEPKRKGKKRMEVEVVVPDTKFTMKEIAELSNISPSLAYIRVQELIKAGKVEVVERKKSESGRGKPLSIYAKTATF